ncbi:hypothetical protein H6P81_015559 [Aristolochia fimbriata]|uniref:Uncharacterized protein n=1 Tax=Aristolochia fimbriata TaxID=158543 RepID=A0AAV7E7Q7_ARIFI|nr:hypothetical protein H6P81_015559 [Aristolochia fimbriata]
MAHVAGLETETRETGTSTTNLEELHKLASINSKVAIRQLPSQGLSFQLWPAASTFVSLFDGYKQQPKESPLFPVLSSISTNPIRILELGSGTGLAGIAAAALLGAHVTLSDLPHVLPNLQFNAEANAGVVSASEGGDIRVQALRWGEAQDVASLGRYDLVMAADVVYHDHLFEPLLQTLSWLLLRGGSCGSFLMAHLRRWKKDSVFFGKARKLFKIDVIHSDPPLPGARIGVTMLSWIPSSLQEMLKGTGTGV